MKKFIKIFSLTLLSLILLVAIGFGITYAVDSDLAKSWLSEIGITIDSQEGEEQEQPSEEDKPNEEVPDEEEPDTPTDEEEPSDEEPEEIEYVTNIADYDFSGNTITAYNGDDKNIAIPSSYSIADTVEYEETFYDEFSLIDHLMMNYNSISYPLTITDSENTEFEIYSEIDVMENEEIVYPVLVMLEKNIYTEGTDYQVTKIDVNVFANKEFEHIVIPNTITCIEVGAFGDCNSLEEVFIPASVTTIGNYAFWRCDNLQSINVDESNPNYTSVDGVLFNKDVTKLIQYPNGKVGDYTVPESVLEIGVNAFTECNNFSQIYLPTNLNKINTPSFEDCENLLSVTIPASVTSMGESSFKYCDNLKFIIFERITPPEIFEGTSLLSCPSLTAIYVPEESVEEYKLALPDCADIIVPNVTASI